MKGRDDLLGCDLYCIRSLNTRDFYTCVREYHFKKKAERNTWLAERASPARQGRKDHFIPAPVAATVCKHCFIAYYGISQATYSRVAKRRINEGQQCFDLTRPKKRWLKEIPRDGVVPSGGLRSAHGRMDARQAEPHTPTGLQPMSGPGTCKSTRHSRSRMFNTRTSYPSPNPTHRS